MISENKNHPGLNMLNQKECSEKMKRIKYFKEAGRIV